MLFIVDDLSYNKESNQSPSAVCYPELNCVAGNAVDRDNSTCTKTNLIGPSSTEKTTWWYVDLGDVYSVHSIRILYKSHGKEYEERQKGRFAGFSLYLSNTTNKEDGHLCYKDGPELPPLDLTINCIGHASHIIFYNERLNEVIYPEGYRQMILAELCEVTVKGCTEGTYGNMCNMHCPKHCQKTRCDVVNGTCMGCKPGWTGKFCQAPCDGGSFGENCKLRCSGHCMNGQTCDHVTGICDEGCASGWTSPVCSESCSYGRFGPNCDSNCSGHCLSGNTCNKETGHCELGCSPGYVGYFCFKACIQGWFGEGCRHRCSGHCTNEEHCNHVDGHCPNGCKHGYVGQLCNKSCAPGYFGKKCSNICSKNCKEICQHTDGSCLCKAGWKESPLCNTECPQKTYGVNCIHSCSTNCANGTCDRFNGSCIEECEEPYYGEMCNQRKRSYNLHSESKTAKQLIIGAVLGVCAFVAILLVLITSLRRQGILRTWIERIRHSQLYVTTMAASTTQRHDSHNYQDLLDFKDKELYVTFETPKDDAYTYQEIHTTKTPSDKGNYANVEFENS